MEGGDRQPVQQLRISTLRKFDKFLKKHRRKGGTYTCSSISTYSFNNDINELVNEDDSEREEDLVSRVDIEEDHMGEIQE